MPAEGRYSIAICKGAALLHETERLLEQWLPDEPIGLFVKRVQKEGILGNATVYRSNDIVRRVFIPRFLKPVDRPARIMKAVLKARMRPSVFRELVFLFAARNDPLIRDFVVREFWPAVRVNRLKMDVSSVLSFFSEAIEDGRIKEPWSEQVSKKVARGLLGLIRDIGFARNASRGEKELIPYRLSDEGLIIIARILHEQGVRDTFLTEHQDWHLFKNGQTSIEKLIEPTGPSERILEVKTRVHQAFFREAVLSSYNETCCITGLCIPECLIAIHIIPWSVNKERRTDPSNGICLSATFDRLYEQGLITITAEMRVEISKHLLGLKNSTVQSLIVPYNNQEIIRPNRFLPAVDSLEWHQKNIFRG